MSRFEGGNEGFSFFFDMSMDGFEIPAGDFVGKAEERLILCTEQ